MAIFSPALPSSKTVQLSVAVVALASLVALLYYGRDFFVTLIISAVFAFILDPVVQFVMKVRLPRPAATFLVIAVSATLAYLLCLVAWTQLLSIRDDLPTYSSRISELLDKTNAGLSELEAKMAAAVVPQNLRKQEQEIQQRPREAMRARRRKANIDTASAAPPAIQEVRIHSDPKPLLGAVFAYVSQYFHVMVLASFVPFLVYFMLSWRDHISETFLELFHCEHQYVVGRCWHAIGESTRAYVLGNFLLWVFLSTISATVFFLLEVPYWPLVGLVSAFLSLVPYVGLPLAVVPPVMAAIAVPNKFKIVAAILICTASLHIVAMNFLYPKVVGKRVRLNPLAVTVSIMFWGMMWGSVGLILAVPLTAAMKAVFDNVASLQGLGRVLGD